MDFDDSFGSGGGGEESLFDFDTTSTSTLNTPMRKVATMKKKKKFGNSYGRRQDSACSNDSASASASASGSIGGSTPRIKQRSKTATADLDDSLSFSSSTKNEATKKEVKVTASRKRILSSRRRLKRQHDDDEDDGDDDLSSTRSSASSCTTNTNTNTTASGSIVRTITTTRVSVRRGMGSSAYAVQDAGTYQMIHDECSYLCSTILSKRIHHSKAIDAAIDLVTLLSNRKTRSILWQGGNSDGVVDVGERNNDDSSLSPSKRPKKMTPIPKIWSSIFEILAMATTSSGTFNKSISSSTSSCNSSIASGSSNRAGMPPTKSRTKSARRKEKEISQTGGVAVNITDVPATNDKLTQKLTPEMKDVLACILYFVSWDCTMSPEHSVAAMGAVKSVSMARKIRLAVLERGAVLSGILRLMAPSPVPTKITPAATIATSSSRVPSSAFSHSSPSKILPSTGTIEPPISPLRQSPARKRSLESSNSNNNSPSSSPSKKAGDPTALGRRNRKKRRKLKMESGAETDPLPSSLTIKMDSIPEQVDVDNVNDDSKNMPPPTKRTAVQQKQSTGRTKSSRRNVHENDELSFADKSSVHKRSSRNNVASGSQSFDGLDDGSSIVSESTVDNSVFMKRMSKKIINLRSKVRIESTEGIATGEGENLQKAFYLEGRCHLRQGIFPEGDCPWLSMVCLESITRILTGKEKEGEPSCLEGEENSGTRGGEMKDDDDIGEDDENNNIFMITNRLIGKSGIIPLLATAMSQSMVVATKLIFASTDYRVDEEYWNYCLTRLKLLASLTDEACFFCEQNRRSFCEDDPFSFEERKEGLIFHILLFLRECSQCDLSQLDQKRSEVMSSALRTLTSLTHDNPLAAEQLKISNVCNASISDNTGEPTDTIRGVDVLAKLVFKLEDTKSIKISLSSLKRSTDHEMHSYDCTLFCLTTFANIIEGSDICRMLTEINVVLQSGSTIPWLKWLCQWIVKQTDSFREEILAIGSTKTKTSNKDTKDGGQNSANDRNSNSNNTNHDEEEELHKHEEEKLVAAGNGCVVLACLMTEPDDDDPESSVTIQTLIKDQMPPNKDGSSSGLTLIVNTLKAYCNYYHISMGQVSFAIIAPVKKLIDELDDIVKVEESPPQE
jgi:hypothetical protein